MRGMQGSGGSESPAHPGPGIPSHRSPSWSLLQGNVVALVHDSGDAEDEENDILLNGLGHQSHLILRAEGLATGFCKDVHGQVRRDWGSLGAARFPSLGCLWDSVRLWGGLVGSCPQVEGKPQKCVNAGQSPPQFGSMHQGRFSMVVHLQPKGSS